MRPETREQRRPLLRWRQTRTDVNDDRTEALSRARGLRQACRATACVMLTAQLWLWVALQLYPQTGRAGWQAALLQALPMLALWALWRGFDASRAPSGAAKAALALLAPCLLWDAGEAMRGLCALCEASLLPAWPRWGLAATFAAALWLCFRLSGPEGVPLGLSQMRLLLLALVLLATVLLGARTSARNLWPLWGDGFGATSLGALRGAGGAWAIALLFALPKEATIRRAASKSDNAGFFARLSRKRDEAPSADPTAARAALAWAALPLGAGTLFALWHSLCAPLSGELSEGQRMLTLFWMAGSPAFFQLGTFCWLLLLLCALAGGAWYFERVARALIPRLPRSLAAGLLAAIALAVALLPGSAMAAWYAVAPYRAALSAVGGALLLIGQGRR